MKINKLVSAIGFSAALVSTHTVAGVASFNWNGYFTVLDAGGQPIHNFSTALPTTNNPTNQIQTAISGTLEFDDSTGAMTADTQPFDFFGASAPGEFNSINIQAIGDGLGGSGTLLMANMLYDWHGTSAIPVSLVLDAAGMFAGEYTSGGNNSAVPSSDGIYISSDPNIQNPSLGIGPGGYTGYLALGPVPIATTAWNLTPAAGCTAGDCQGVNPSGVLPLVADNVDGWQDYTDNTGAAAGVTGVGGNPMMSGPFQGSNFNFDITTMVLTDYADDIVISAFDYGQGANVQFPDPGISSVPVPAAVWLFGSGLLGLLGVARRRVAKDDGS